MPYLIFLFVCAVWSVSFLLMKKAALVFSPASVALWRTVGGVVILLAIWGWQRRGWSLRRGDSLTLFAVVAAGFAWPYYIQPAVIGRHGSAFMAMAVSLVPFVTIVCSLFVLRVRPSLRQLIGVVVALVCMCILMWDGLARSIPLVDLGLAATVPLGYAAANTVIRWRLSHASPLDVTIAALGGSSVMLLPFAVISDSPATSAEGQWAWAVVSLAFLGIVGTGLATVLFNKMIRDHGPLFAGMTTNVVPIGAVVWGWIDQEPISARQLAALAGIIVMVTLVQFRAAAKSGTLEESLHRK